MSDEISNTFDEEVDSGIDESIDDKSEEIVNTDDTSEEIVNTDKSTDKSVVDDVVDDEPSEHTDKSTDDTTADDDHPINVISRDDVEEDVSVLEEEVTMTEKTGNATPTTIVDYRNDSGDHFVPDVPKNFIRPNKDYSMTDQSSHSLSAPAINKLINTDARPSPNVETSHLSETNLVEVAEKITRKSYTNINTTEVVVSDKELRSSISGKKCKVMSCSVNNVTIYEVEQNKIYKFKPRLSKKVAHMKLTVDGVTKEYSQRITYTQEIKFK